MGDGLSADDLAKEAGLSADDLQELLVLLQARKEAGLSADDLQELLLLLQARSTPDDIQQWAIQHMPSKGRKRKSLSAKKSAEEDASSFLGLLPSQQKRMEDADLILSKRQKKKTVTVEHKPSDFVRRDTWRIYQFPDKEGAFEHAPLYLCHRGPPEARPAMPLELLHESFMHFFRNTTDAPEANDLHLASTLRKLLSSGFDVEGDMRATLNTLLSAYLDRPVAPTMVGNKYLTDGKLERGLFTEYKSQIGSSGDPHFEGLEYMRISYEEELSLNPHKVPHGLLLSVVCPYMQVTGVCMDVVQKKLLAQPLTHFMNCYGEEYAVEEVARVLRAVRLFVGRYARWDSRMSSIPWPLRSHNEVMDLKKMESTQVEAEPISRRGGQRLIYIFRHTDGTLKVAKFVRKYCIQAHRAWHRENLAPAAEIQVLGAGWTLVEMPYLRSEDGWRVAFDVVTEKKTNSTFISELSYLLQSTLTKGHGTGYVHGDFRLNNMLLRWKEDEKRREVQLIDFDWSGEIGKAVYPALLNNETIEWHPEAGYGKLIEKEHDMWFVQHLLEQVQP